MKVSIHPLHASAHFLARALNANSGARLQRAQLFFMHVISHVSNLGLILTRCDLHVDRAKNIKIAQQILRGSKKFGIVLHSRFKGQSPHGILRQNLIQSLKTNETNRGFRARGNIQTQLDLIIAFKVVGLSNNHRFGKRALFKIVDHRFLGSLVSIVLKNFAGLHAKGHCQLTARNLGFGCSHLHGHRGNSRGLPFIDMNASTDPA